MTSETTIAQPPACRYCGREGTQLEGRPCCDRPEHADRALACADTADCLAVMLGLLREQEAREAAGARP